jgi:hypothetical protein
VRTALPSTALAALLFASRGLADSPPPKVCVVVAGDPDAAVQAAATTLTDAIATRDGLRGVADADTRAVLRGETRTEPALAPYASARRALGGVDGDAPVLDDLGQRLGCAIAVELAARPTGTRVRAYDVVHRVFRPAIEVSTVAPPLVDHYVLPHARAAMEPSPPPSPAALTATAAASSTAPTAPATGGSAPSTPVRRTVAPAPRAIDPRANLGDDGGGRAAGRSDWWPWAVAGGAALLLVGGFFLAQSGGAETPVITVTHAGTGGER